MTVIMDGKALSLKRRGLLAEKVTALPSKPGLAVVLVGDDPASQVYVRNKCKQTEAVGMTSLAHRLPASTPQADLLNLLHDLNTNPDIHGILVQLPLPGHIDQRVIIESINPAKDVDGFHPINVGKLQAGIADLVPCTPLGCLRLLEEYDPAPLAGRHAVVVGRSHMVGKPVANLLLNANCTVTIAHSRTKNIAEVCRQADILVAAVGRAELVKGDWIKDGATVIDVGINRTDTGNLVGDVDYAEASKRAAYITPVPGGVGPMTIACLLENTYIAYKAHNI